METSALKKDASLLDWISLFSAGVCGGMGSLGGNGREGMQSVFIRPGVDGRKQHQG